MKAYGIWRADTQEWVRNYNVLLVFYTVGAAEAQRDIMGNPIFLEVAEIGEDGLPVEVEND